MSFLIPFDFHKGDRLDGLTVDMPIAHGGNGDLYLVHEDDGTFLALKVIRKTDNTGEFNGIDQCRAVSSHISGLVSIRKVGKLDDGRVYCVMQAADNLAKWPDYEPDTLASRVRRNGRLSPDGVLDIAAKILVTIRELHDAGLAHCDIKPDNILFIGGEPKLADYSLLSDTMNDAMPPSSGTIGSIPPEMLTDPDLRDPKACDLYAVGKLIYCAWSGSDIILFPSVPKDITLREIGIMRPIYMKACSSSPTGRFKSADEFTAAVSDARFRLKHSVRTRIRSDFRKNLPVLLTVLLILLCAIGLANIFLLLKNHSGNGKRETGDGGNATDVFFEKIDDEREANGGKQTVHPFDPLNVTTDLDVVDANDGVTSLREALDYARRHGAGATVSFIGDHTVRLATSLSIALDVIIDGAGNSVTLIGPETEPMFQLKEAKLTLKDMALISDYAGGGGGVLDAEGPGRVVLSSVKDGGKANCLWRISGKVDMDLEDGSHLHRARFMPQSGGGNIRIKAGTALEDLTYAGDTRNIGEGNCDVNGLLKNAIVSDSGDIYVNPGGTAENITVKKNGFLDVRPDGTVNGVNVEFGGVMGYMDKGIVTGTVSISGVAWEPCAPGPLPRTVDGVQAFPVIDARNTDIVFDLTERTEDSRSRFGMNVEVRFDAGKNIIEGPGATRLLFNDLASFLGAHSYSVRVRDDQPAGTYPLGTQADKFDSAVSIMIGDTVYRDALSVGKSFSAGNRAYTLVLDYWESRNGGYPTNREVRTLMLKVDVK